MSVADYLSIVQAALATLLLSAASIAIGIPLGLALALAWWGRLPGARPMVRAYVSAVRSCPMITLTLLIYFGIGQIGLDFDPLTAAVVALAINTSAFNCEIWRSGLIAFPKDQYDAALAFAMPRRVRFFRIVFPQVWRASLPALFNEMTLQIKTTPAVAVIGIVEITRAALRVGAKTYEPLPPFLFALVLYSLIVFVFVRLQRVVERRWAQVAA